MLSPLLVQNAVLLESVKEAFQSLTHRMHEAYRRHEVDRTLVYALLSYDLGLPYMTKNLGIVFEKLFGKWESRIAWHRRSVVDQAYVRFVKQELSLSSQDSFKVAYGKMLLEGTHGVAANRPLARTVFETCNSKEVALYLGYERLGSVM